MKKWLFLLTGCLISTVLFAASPLPANDVFPLTVQTSDPNGFTLNWQIKPGYFLYSDRINISVNENSNLHLGQIMYPKPQIKTDKQGRSFPVYRNDVAVHVPVLGISPGESLIKLHYQGCADDGFCYPPETVDIKLAINGQMALDSAQLDSTVQVAPQPAATSSQDQIESLFSARHWTLVLLTFFGFGILLSFTPCILPMVPVLSGIIVGHGGAITTRKAFLLSLSYVLSMAATYAVIGAIVAKLGSNLQIIMQAPWAIITFSLIFVVLALSMFGFYDLKLPATWQNRLAALSRNQSSGHYLGAAVMGCLSTLILSPCVTAPLIGALGYIAHSGNVFLGSASLFFLGLGMGMPLILIGTSAGKWLPEAGSWMNAVKAFFGILLLAVAIYLLGRIIPDTLTMGLWAVLLIFSGIYAGALTPALTNAGKFCQGIGLVLLVYGILILIGASMGGTNPLQPLAAWAAGRHAPDLLPLHKSITNLNELEQAISQAEGKPVMLDYYADWCASCVVMENTTFKETQVSKALQNFTVFKIDVTANNSDSKALMEKFKVIAPPTFIFLDNKGGELTQLRLVGELSGSEFIERLNAYYR
ncbi:protein-disulfide reductase DsbD [Legionella dresdenensis]|uniref:Protein-disulfide reductase DsbD n=1 Tax=Legionella dresdenensis TaxID=450200 RepID=A0ABV8CI05_9GAMM